MMGHMFRKSMRRQLVVSVLLSTESGEPIVKTNTIEVSVDGAKLALESAVMLPAQSHLAFSDNGRVRRLCRVAWRTADTIGVAYI